MLKTPVSGALALGLMAVAPAAAAEHVRASWYGGGHERLNARTASGESFNPRALTCAHRSLPFGTRLRVTYRGRSIVVRVNDRGPTHKDWARARFVQIERRCPWHDARWRCPRLTRKAVT